MNKKETNKKFDEMKKKLNDVQSQIKDSAETIALEGMEAKDKVQEKIKDTKGETVALKEQLRLNSERAKSKFSSALLKAQMDLEVAKEKMQDKKDARDKEKLSKYIDDELDYAADCIEYSLLAAKEAKLAMLEAIEAQAEYDEKYGDDD